jgi:hypothetical protein
MNITKKISLLLFVILSAFSCDELDELTEFNITEGFSTSFNIDLPDLGEGMPASITETATIDISSVQEIQDNLDLIQNIAINSLTYEIRDFTGAEDATITEASLSFNGTSISVSNINLQESDDNNTVYEIEDTTLFNSIANDLGNNPEITATITGTINATPVKFDVIVNLDVTVTVDVL